MFDTFPDGSSVLGGAPFNVAWHLKGFGLDPLFISRIGADDKGQDVRQKMLDWGMDVSGLQQDSQHNTGTVTIELKDGQPSFTILPKQAYDFIEQEKSLELVKKHSASLLYFGTLINRHDVSKNTLSAIRKLNIPTFVDINLRTPWWNESTIADAIKNTNWVKLNDDEIRLVTKQDDLAVAAKVLINQYSLSWIIVTKGAEGAFIATEDQILECQPAKVDHIVDTVGAGDAFSSVTLYGIVQNWPLQTILQRAVEFAAQVCMVRGATIHDQSIYQQTLEKWFKE